MLEFYMDKGVSQSFYTMLSPACFVEGKAKGKCVCTVAKTFTVFLHILITTHNFYEGFLYKSRIYV